MKLINNSVIQFAKCILLSYQKCSYWTSRHFRMRRLSVIVQQFLFLVKVQVGRQSIFQLKTECLIDNFQKIESYTSRYV